MPSPCCLQPLGALPFLQGDNDPVDVVEIGSAQLKMGGVYRVKPLGEGYGLRNGEKSHLPACPPSCSGADTPALLALDSVRVPRSVLGYCRSPAPAGPAVSGGHNTGHSPLPRSLRPFSPCPRPAGVYAMIDDGELDWKVIAINIDDPKAASVNDIEDVER